VSNVCDRALVADDIFVPALFQMLVKHAIQASRLVLIPVDTIRDLFWRISRKVICLTLHRSDSSVLIEQPVIRLDEIA